MSGSVLLLLGAGVRLAVAHGVRELQGFAHAPRTEFPSRAPRTEVLRNRAQKKTEAFQFLRLLLVRAYLPEIR